ncbi:MAG: T9SS type A sorting domain-containing protein, partial [Bacteroidetes bacterium]|nr:T9SS type A sorting domain-containing protein [Bacteroidota bacterium]
HSLAIKTDGTLWAWGWNDSGQLGDGTFLDKNSPVKIGTDNNWQIVAADGKHSLAIKMDGTLWAWGLNDFGQLGDGTPLDKNSPVKIGAASNWQSVTAGERHSVAIKTDGTLWAWGFNNQGILGDGTSIPIIYSPVQIGTANNWESATAGVNNILAIKTDGTLWAWGNNTNGTLGDGTYVHKYSPVQIGTANNWESVAVGAVFTLAIKTDGTLWAWGNNNQGQLGNGTNTWSNIPIPIGTVGDWHNIATGLFHSLAIKTDGSLWAWGYNNEGELGNGTEMNINSPAETICPVTGITDNLQPAIMDLYPNPVKEFLNITLYSPNTVDMSYEICNLFGQVVVPNQVLLGSSEINVQSLLQGYYFLTVRKGSRQLTKSFVKI